MATIEAISTQRADSTVLGVHFTSIPGTYQHLALMISSKNVDWSTMVLPGVFNDPTVTGGSYSSAGYFNNRLAFYDSTSSEVAGADSNYYYNVTQDGNDTPAGVWGGSRWIIYDYANTNKNTSIMTWNSYKLGGGSHVHTSTYTPNIHIGAGGWHENTAVTSVEIGFYSATQYPVMRGFEATLFGIKDS